MTAYKDRENDITAPDGYVLGGFRVVRRDGTILFQRGWWQAPMEWVGYKVWVHEEWVDSYGNPHGSRANNMVLDVAPPGMHIHEARLKRVSVHCERTDRKDAKPNYRRADRKAWAAR